MLTCTLFPREHTRSYFRGKIIHTVDLFNDSLKIDVVTEFGLKILCRCQRYRKFTAGVFNLGHPVYGTGVHSGRGAYRSCKVCYFVIYLYV